MSKQVHDVICCITGERALREALKRIDDKGWPIVAIVPDTGGPISTMFSSGRPAQLMIVVRKS